MGLLASSVLAHPGHHAGLSGSDLQSRASINKRCASAAASMNAKRYAKRNLQRKRDLEARSNTTYTITTEAPYYEVIQNDTCVLTPEVTEGPYVWPRSQTLRQDMTEGQAGVPMWLDVGVIDIETCEPLEKALVDFWHCNATGSYSSFTKLSPNTAFETLLNDMNITDFEIGVTDLHTDDTTFLRGMWPTDSEGMMEMKTSKKHMYPSLAKSGI
jgi:protocatechuate 3,4-dioxygenase beta subunit